MTPAEAGRKRAAELGPPPPELLRRIADLVRPSLTVPRTEQRSAS